MKQTGVGIVVSLLSLVTVQAAEPWYGTDRLSVRLDETTGFPAEYRVDGRCVVTATDSRQPFVLKENWYAVTNDGTWRVESVTFASNVLTSVTRAGNWRVTHEMTLHPETRRIRRAFRLDWLCDAPCKLRGLAIDGGTARLGASGSYALPCVWPVVDVKARDLRPGVRHETYESPYSVLAADGAGTTVTWIVDDTEPDCDAGFTVATERADGVSVTHPFSSAGIVEKGKPQTLGGLWMCFGEGPDTESALKALPAWFAAVGQHVPGDRPDWLHEAVIYSMYPGGTVQSRLTDWGGFGPSATQLPRIAALGANVVWMLPVEEYGPYIPHDYFSIAASLGTREDYLAFVTRAKREGLRVFRDIVPHGGAPDSVHFRGREDCLLQDEAGVRPGYWCSDFANPKWQAFMRDVAARYVADGLDGLRADASSGSPKPNWDPAIPYMRASMAMRPGGYRLQRAILEGVRAANPGAALLTESDLSFSANVADVLYDWSLAFRLIRNAMPGDVADQVAAMRRYLRDELYAQVPGHLRLRYQENHDCHRSALQYGGAAMEAVQAMLAWMPGVAFVYQDQETGHTFAFREIYRIRREHPELTRGVPDYLGVPASPGVYAASFTLSNVTSVVRVNLNGVAADGLAPFGYRLTTNGRTVFDSATASSVGKASGAVRRWCAATADGFYADELGARHPANGDPRMQRKRSFRPHTDGSCLFDSRLHPFGFTPDCAFVAYEDATGAVWRADAPAGAEVRLSEREDPRACGLDFRPVAAFPVRPAPTTGDARLTAIFGGWRFEEGRLRVDLTRGGSLKGVWRRNAAGAWERAVGEATPAVRKGYGPKVYDAIWEMEAFVRFARADDGRLTLVFTGGLRDRTRFGLPWYPLPYEITYTFGGENGFTMRPVLTLPMPPEHTGGLVDLVVGRGEADAPGVTCDARVGNVVAVEPDDSVLLRANWIKGSGRTYRLDEPSGLTVTFAW